MRLDVPRCISKRDYSRQNEVRSIFFSVVLVQIMKWHGTRAAPQLSCLFSRITNPIDYNEIKMKTKVFSLRLWPTEYHRQKKTNKKNTVVSKYFLRPGLHARLSGWGAGRRIGFLPPSFRFLSLSVWWSRGSGRLQILRRFFIWLLELHITRKWCCLTQGISCQG